MYIGSKKVDSKEDVKELSRSEKKIYNKLPDSTRRRVENRAPKAKPKKAGTSIDPKTEAAIKSGELRTDDDFYVVSGDVAASRKTAEILAESKRQDFERRQAEKAEKTRKAKKAAYEQVYKPIMQEQIERTIQRKRDVHSGKATPVLTKSPDPLTGVLLPTVGYEYKTTTPSPQVISSEEKFIKDYYRAVENRPTETFLQPQKGDFIAKRSKETLLDPTVQEPILKAGSKVVDFFGKTTKTDTEPFKQTVKESYPYMAVAMTPEVQYEFSRAFKPTTVGEYVTDASIGFVGGQITELRDKPIKTTVLIAAGAGMGITGRSIATIGSKSEAVVKGIGLGVGTVYVGTKGLETYTAPSVAEKGAVIGGASVEVGAMGLGAAATSGVRVVLGRTKITGGSKQYYTYERQLSEPKTAEIGSKTITESPTGKQIQTRTVPKAGVRITNLKGVKEGRPFRSQIVEPSSEPLSDVYITTKWGKYTYRGKITGGVKIPREITVKTFKGDKLVSTTTEKLDPKTNIQLEQLTSAKYAKQFSNLDQTQRALVTKQAETFKGSRSMKVGKTRIAEEELLAVKGQRTVAKFQSTPTVRRLERSFISYGGRFRFTRAATIKPTKIKFGKDYKSPADITLIGEGEHMLIKGVPTTKYRLMIQRGGFLRGDTKTKPYHETQYIYEEQLNLLIKKVVTLSGKRAQAVAPKERTIPLEPQFQINPSEFTGELSASKINTEVFGSHKFITKPVRITYAPSRLKGKAKSRQRARSATTTIITADTMTDIGDIETSISGSRQSPTVSTKVLSKPFTDTKIVTETKTQTDTDITTATQTLTSTPIITYPIGGIGGVTIDPFDIPPPIPPPTPIDIPLGFLGPPKGKGVTRRGGRGFLYKPDLLSVLTGETRKGKAPKGQLTGLEGRPIYKQDKRKWKIQNIRLV